VAADDDGGTRLAGQRADDIPGLFVHPLLLNRAPYVVEKIFVFGLTLPGSHGAAGEPILQ
jgi:hypothetical protein